MYQWLDVFAAKHPRKQPLTRPFTIRSINSFLVGSLHVSTATHTARPVPTRHTFGQIMLATGEPALALLPTRFRKLIWVKRGDFLITSTSAGDFETSAGEAGKVYT